MSTQAKRVLLADGRRQAGVVEDRPPVFLRVHDRLDVHQARSAIKRQPKLARERADRDVADGDGGAVALAGDANPFQLELASIGLERSRGRRVEEDIEDAHAGRAVRRGLTSADQQKSDRVGVFDQHVRGLTRLPGRFPSCG